MAPLQRRVTQPSTRTAANASSLGAVRQLPVRPREVARVAVGVPLQVVLVLGFRFPERPGCDDLGDDLAGPESGGFDVGDRVLRDSLLLIIGVEDRRAIARP